MSYEKSLSIMVDLADEVQAQSRKLMLNIDRRVVRETPRDTGSAKASWLTSVGSPNNDIVNVDDSVSLGAAELMAIEQGAAAINKAKAFDAIYIQNNQPYIEALNEGSSLQAPSNFVDTIIEQEVARS